MSVKNVNMLQIVFLGARNYQKYVGITESGQLIFSSGLMAIDFVDDDGNITGKNIPYFGLNNPLYVIESRTTTKSNVNP